MIGIRFSRILGAALVCVCAVRGQDAAALSRLLDRIVAQEKRLTDQMRTRSPLVETYIQETAVEGSDHTPRDHYFLGRLSLALGMKYTPVIDSSEVSKGSRPVLKSRPIVFYPNGFAQMVFIDADAFDRQNYTFDYVRREFLGDVRTIVLDVAPADTQAVGRFKGRIWVEDRDLQIVRFNGTYTGSKPAHLYFHFDSWRINVAPGQWTPAMIYIEESGGEGKRNIPLTFKAQTRLWGYNSGKVARLDELTNLLVEVDTPGRDATASVDASPLENQRAWERQAEDNILDRLEKAGLLAPKGEAETVLDTVVQNLVITGKLSVSAHCRVLLTTPLETFTAGHTILISRGLLDVLPDEASLAMVLSDELAHIALGHTTNTQFAFQDETMFTDEQLLQRFRFARPPWEIAAAGKKAIEILRQSPYKDKLSNAGLFLKALASRAPRFPNLIRANIGNRLADGSTVTRMAELASGAPALEDNKLEQIAALPLGSRIKLNPWTDRISLIQTTPVMLLSAREKMLFEISAFAPHLARVGEGGAEASTKPADK
jgi:Peptidase family M48